MYNVSSTLNVMIYCFLTSLLLTSCGEDSQDLTSEEQLQNYFAEQNISPLSTSTGLYYIIDEPGSSEKPTKTSSVTVHYEGFFLDGNVFDSSYDRGMPSSFSLREVIAGWTEGIPLFGKGGKGSLYVPFELAYGSQGRGSIPGNTAIAFRIELIDF